MLLVNVVVPPLAVRPLEPVSKELIKLTPPLMAYTLLPLLFVPWIVFVPPLMV